MKKLLNQDGFTLTELLCVIAVLVVIGATVIAGIRFSSKTYETSVSYSEAQILCSTLTTTISDELRYSGAITQHADGSWSFFSPNYGKSDTDSCGFSENDEGQILLGDKKLLSSSAYTRGLQAKIELNYNTTTSYFEVQLSILSSSNKLLVDNQFQVEPINHPTVHLAT